MKFLTKRIRKHGSREPRPAAMLLMRALGLIAALMWMIHPVVHACETFGGHSHNDSPKSAHYDTQCPLGSVRDHLEAPTPAIGVPPAPFCPTVEVFADSERLFDSAPVDPAALPRPPPFLH